MSENQELDRFLCDHTYDNDDFYKRFYFIKNHNQYVYAKAKWLFNYLTEISDKINLDENYRLLDYGCGMGEMLRWLKRFGFPGQLHGADISRAMLEKAERRWDAASKPLFSCIGEIKTDFADNSFSCIVATCVFHHIAPDKRDAVLAEIKSILIPGGIIVIFEHNPLNPLTRAVVKKAAVDKNAKLIYPAELRNHLQRAGFENCFFKYITFFSPSINMLYGLEKYLRWCPLGAQYVSVGRGKKG